MTDAQYEELKDIVASSSLQCVLEALADVCTDNSGTGAPDASLWQRAARVIRSCAAKPSIEIVS